MSKAAIYSAAGSKKEQPLTLNKAIFGQEVNHELIKLAYQRYLANARGANAVTLTRGEVRGGGRKPWRQKGTGRARVGSIRVPNWRGGGVVFGPSGEENYRLEMPLKMRQAAMRQALSAKAKADRVVVLEDFKTEGRVKDSLHLLGKLGVDGRILLVVDNKNDLVDRATRNLPHVIASSAGYLNVFNLMNADWVIITKAGLDVVEAWLGEAKTKPEPAKEAANA